MDYSALTEAQQQQYQQFLSQYQQHQDQQQQQQLQQQPQQDPASQPYDPSSQTQPYDQSNQAYYYQQYVQQQQQQQQQPYPYYPPEYAAAPNAYQQPPSQPDSNLQPPGLVNPAEPQQPQPQPQPQPNPYVPQPVAGDVPPGLNPAAAAAVAALSQLTQFAGNMDAAERRAMAERHWHAKMAGGQHPMPPHGDGPVRPDSVGRSPYRGGGRRGGGPFRGGGRGNFGHNPPRSDSRSPPFRGRGRMGRGRGRGGRRFPHPSSGAPSSNPESAGVVSPPSVPPAKPRRVPKVAWCDLCRVDCNTEEILEIHKNGKRHKKLLQKMEELGMPVPVSESQPKPVSESQPKPVSESDPNPVSDSQPKPVEEPENTHGEGENKDSSAQENLPIAQENLATEPVTDEHKMETEQEIGAAEQSEIVADEKLTDATPYRKRRMDHFDARRRGGTRNMRGRGGKRFRSSGMVGGSDQPLPKEQPKFCSICNVTCDTQAVFECHLAGKKHLTRIKRYPDQEGTYGTAVPHPVYVPPSQPTVFNPQTGDGEPLVQQQDMGTTVQEFVSEPGGQEAVMAESVGMAIVSEVQGKEASVVPENSAPSLMNDVKGDANVIQTAENVPVSAFVGEAILPGLDIKVDEHSSNNELPTNQETGSQ